MNKERMIGVVRGAIEGFLDAHFYGDESPLSDGEVAMLALGIVDGLRGEEDERGWPRPFSGADYHEQARRQPVDSDPCVLCGRPVTRGYAGGLLRVVEGGERFAGRDEVVGEAGDMGYFPIGAYCLREHPELRPILLADHRSRPRRAVGARGAGGHPE